MMEPVDPFEVALIVTRALDELGVPNTIGGSIASSFAGEPRSTIDIDIVLALEDAQIAPLVKALSPAFYVEEEALRRAVRDRSNANLIHQDTMLKVDLFVAGGTPLDKQQIVRRLAVDIGGGRVLHVHPPEDILLQKLHWFRLGGGVSDRQWRDVVAIIRAQGTGLDREYLHSNAPLLGVQQLLERALDEGNAWKE